ncbi:DUF2442 domain-containing protein [Sinanaerobacter chloroacetimidivorans]|jgi:hypothetical protein|uniref:DUF2442 domain-containing protein n=1 Tax=Sinanaerobacter chloroacetimidivorans TaxID=2818044 RepID=A0A8J7W2Z1_9FIRM|nr:DUF2442 domain-containing protein [Sinanaerobacter chloroacetimidivorans]MBR0599927.1 DUF2442 domain-containing protein [Sinanaerobacter chloroacetimidivorans]
MPTITSVQPMRNFMIKVGFDNGTIVTLNMEHKLNTIRFQQLRDRALFCSAVTDGYSIKWNEFIEISITEIFEIAQIS